VPALPGTQPRFPRWLAIAAIATIVLTAWLLMR
jgi:hypothetical protein